MTEPVSAQKILDTAASLIERQGVESFTMRGLAEELGVAATSIYWHVGGTNATERPPCFCRFSRHWPPCSRR
jgi:hypothetical protein